MRMATAVAKLWVLDRPGRFKGNFVYFGRPDRLRDQSRSSPAAASLTRRWSRRRRRRRLSHATVTVTVRISSCQRKKRVFFGLKPEAQQARAHSRADPTVRIRLQVAWPPARSSFGCKSCGSFQVQ